MATELGRVYLTGCNYEFAYDLLSQDAITNSSNVRLYGILHVTNNQIRWDSGSAYVHTETQNIGTYYAKGDHTIITKDFTFYHDNNGNFSQYMGAGLSTTFVSGSTGGTLTLPSISRASQPSCITWPQTTRDVGNIGDTITIHMNRKNTNYYHTVTCSWYNKNITIATNVADNCQWTIPDNFAEDIPNQKQSWGTIYAHTYYNGTLIGVRSVEFDCHVANANPTYSEAYEDTNATTLAITNNDQQIIRNNSTLEINLTNMQALKYATLSTAKAIIDGTTYTGTINGTSCTINVGTLNLSSNVTADIEVTDSRGFKTIHQLPITILDWELPTGIIALERQSNYYSETDIKVDGSYSSLDSKNQMTIKTRYKKTTDQTYGAYTTLQDNVTTTLTLDNLYSWDVQVLIEDLIGSTTYNLSLGIGLPILFIDRIKRSVGVECFPQDSNSLEVLGNNIKSKIDGLIGTILWSNSTPTTSFAGQTITLNSTLNDYDFYEIIFMESNTISRIMTSGLIPVGFGTRLNYVSGYPKWRTTEENVSGNTITFDNCNSLVDFGTPVTEDTSIIPLYIIGHNIGVGI